MSTLPSFPTLLLFYNIYPIQVLPKFIELQHEIIQVR